MRALLLVAVVGGCADRPLPLPDAPVDMAALQFARVFFLDDGQVQSPQAYADSTRLGCDAAGAEPIGNCCRLPEAPHVTFLRSRDMGQIEFLDGTRQMATISFDSGVGGYPFISSATSSEIHWQTGDALSVRVSGGVVHGFAGAVDAVALPRNLQPDLSRPVTVAAQGGFTLQFDAQPDTAANLEIAEPGDGGHALFCTASPGANTLAVPAAALQRLIPGIEELIFSVKRTRGASSDDAVATLASTGLVTGSMQLQ